MKIIPDYYGEQSDQRDIDGISFHRQFIYPKHGEIILRKIYGRGGHDVEKTSKYPKKLQYIVGENPSKELSNYVGNCFQICC